MIGPKQAMSSLVQIGKINFRFECQPGCIECCTQAGEVYLTADDVSRIASHLGQTADHFQSTLCDTDVDGDLRLTTPPDKACHFLLEDGCSIHAVKPLQCRAYPFWPENVAGRRAWKNAGRMCPGIGVGPILPVEDIRAAAQECKDALP